MTANPDDPAKEAQSHQAALAYIRRGMKVFPLKQNTKVPDTIHGVHDASNEETAADLWFANERNIAIALPPGVVVVDIDRHGNTDGMDAVNAWCEQHGDAWFADAPLAVTAGDGFHLWFAHPGGKLRKNPAVGVDLLWEGRYVVAPPSVINGAPYEWRKQLPRTVLPEGLDQLPTWFIDLARPLDREVLDARVRDWTPTNNGRDELDDAAHAYTSWQRLLGDLGWKHVGGASDPNADGARWRRPGSENPFSATIRHGCLFNYSSSTSLPMTETGDPHGITLFAAIAHLHHGGDMKAAAQTLRDAGKLRSGGVDKDALLSWMNSVVAPPQQRPVAEAAADVVDEGVNEVVEPHPLQPIYNELSASEALFNAVARRRTEARAREIEHIIDAYESAKDIEPFGALDLDPFLAGDVEVIRPELFRPDDGSMPLLYAGRVNGIHGDSGIGKTMIAVVAAYQELCAGRDVDWIDLEEPSPMVVIERLRMLGLADQVIAEHLHYYRPTMSLEAMEVEYLIAEAANHATALIVLDSLGEAFGLAGINEDKDAEVGPWLRNVVRRLTDETGAAMLMIDHSTKAADNPLHPSGSKRKRAAITGASYLVDAQQALTRATGGKLWLTVAKDRHGHHRRGTQAGGIELAHDLAAGALRLTVNGAGAAPVKESAKGPAIRAARRACDVLRERGPLSQTALWDAVTHDSNGEKVIGRPTAKAGVALAVADGAIDVVTAVNGGRSTYSYVRDYTLQPTSQDDEVHGSEAGQDWDDDQEES